MLNTLSHEDRTVSNHAVGYYLCKGRTANWFGPGAKVTLMYLRAAACTKAGGTGI